MRLIYACPKKRSVVVCSTTIPNIGNGVISSSTSDAEPYFIGESIVYECNDNYAPSNVADLTNQCVENPGNGVPAVWARMTDDLTGVCQPGNSFRKLLRNKICIDVIEFFTSPAKILYFFET